jgi:hypothetical protein
MLFVPSVIFVQRFLSKLYNGAKKITPYVRNFFSPLLSKGAWVLPLLKWLKPFLNLQPENSV